MGYGVSIKVPTKMLSALRSLPDSALGRGPSGRQVVLPEAFLCTRQLKAPTALLDFPRFYGHFLSMVVLVSVGILHSH